MGVIIYGAGYLGLHVCDLLMANHIDVICIIDKDKNKQGKIWSKQITICGLQNIKKTDNDFSVVVAHMDCTDIYKSIKQDLENCGFSNIVHVFEFAKCNQNKAIFKEQNCIIAIQSEKVVKNLSDIATVRKALCDQSSVQTFQQIVESLSKETFNAIKSYPISQQYFAYDVYKKSEKEVFVDIGGGPNGDVLKGFLERNNKYLQYYFFEPDENIGMVKKQQKYDERIRFINAAIGNQNTKVRLKNYFNMNSVIVKDGEQEVDCIRLDDFNFEYLPTFIKIDTEGYERKVLEGAQEIIDKARPIIACAIYHKIEDFWEIPLYLINMLREYKFYIRSYLNISETIFYAVPKERWVEENEIY